MSSFIPGPSGSSTNTLPRPVSIDSNTVFRVLMNNVDDNLVLTDSVSSMGNWTTFGTPTMYPSVFGKKMQLDSDATTHIGFRHSATEEPNTLTLSAWITPVDSTKNSCGSYGRIITKYAQDNTWSNPYFTIMSIDIRNTTTIAAGLLTVGGWVYTEIPNATLKYLICGTRNHLAMTYDTNVFKFYINGTKMSELVGLGNVDYVNHGEWGIGSLVTSSYLEHFCGGIEEIRFDKVVKSESEILDIYKTGMGWI